MPMKDMKQEPHDNHHQMMAMDFRKRFIVFGGVTVPILILSPTIRLHSLTANQTPEFRKSLDHALLAIY